ncbi:MAG: hypothetical protein N2690_01255 [Rhodocyclaceae bacterium]|nr:hypothetical protein [Rhodocyclaceae bacterium]
MAWVRQALQQGRTLTDPGLFVAGADGVRIMRQLRREGMPIKTVYIKTVDASGTAHPRTLAWRLDS